MKQNHDASSMAKLLCCVDVGLLGYVSLLVFVCVVGQHK